MMLIHRSTKYVVLAPIAFFILIALLMYLSGVVGYQMGKATAINCQDQRQDRKDTQGPGEPSRLPPEPTEPPGRALGLEK